MADRRLISSGGPWEKSVGYSRAVVVGDACWVSGTTDAGPDHQSLHPGDAGAQARAVWRIIETRARARPASRLRDVVRTRMYVVAIEDAPAVMAVHGELFGEIRPASSLVQVAALIEPTMLVEIEAEARRT